MTLRPLRLAPALAVLVVACTDPPSPPPAPSGPTHGRAVPAPASTRLGSPAEAASRMAFQRVDVPPPAWDVENRRRLDPAADGWPSESFHERAKPRFDGLLRAVFTAGGASLAPWLAEDFQGATVLRPALTDIRPSGACRVLRPASIERERRPPAELDALAAALRSPVGDASPRLESRFESVDALEGGYRTVVRWLACSNTVWGLLQQDSRWALIWSAGSADAPPRVRSIELVDYSESVAERALFADHTASWLASAPGVAEEFRSGLSERHFRNDSLTGNALLGGQGIAVGDVDGDGLEDVYVAMQGGLPNRLLLGRPDGTVVDATSRARLGLLDNTRGVLIVDLDDDGARDVVMAIHGNLLVAYNDGTAVFREQLLLRAPGVEDIFSIAAADADGDGDLDLYCCRYVKGGMISGVPTPYHDADNGASNVYWRNDGRGKFTDATAEVGLDHNNSRYSLAAIWEDFDDDGDLDLYVANDFGRNNLYRNDGGRFVDVAREAGAEDPAAGMGVSVADFDLDGRLDLYLSNMYSAAGLRISTQPTRFLDGRHRDVHAAYTRHARGNTMLRGLGGGRFEDVTERLGVGPAGWAWGALFVDFDGDGYEDLFSPNAFITGDGAYDVESFFWRRVISQSPQDPSPTEAYRNAWGSMQRMVMEDGASYNGNERDTAFLNLGGASFADVSFVAGLDALSDSRAVARIDWDDDGRLDLLVKSRSGPRVRLLRNQQPTSHHFLVLELTGRTCNVDAIGARVTVELEGRTLRKSVYAGEGYLAQSSRRLHFGLGAQTVASRVVVRWPSGVVSKYEGLRGDARYSLVEGEAEAKLLPSRVRERFERSLPAPLAAPGAPLVRVPLAERVPMAAYSFTMLDGSRRQLREFVGAPVVLTLWSAKAKGCAEELGALAATLRESPSGARWITATLDQGADLLEARRLAAALGLADQTALLDPHAAKLIELQFLFVIGRSHHVPLPTSLSFDGAGQWCLAYLGAAPQAELLADLATIAQLDLTSRATTKLVGGRWLARGGRDWNFLAGICRDLGANDLAQFYAEIAAVQGK